MNCSIPRTVAFLLASCLAPLASANQVWTVGCCGNDFLQAQDAVNAASNGDLILLRTLSAGDFVVDGKSLTVVKDSPFPHPGKPSFSNIRVQNLAAGQKFVLRSVDMNGNGTGRIEVFNCAGPVLLEDVKMSLDVRNSASVMTNRSFLRGRDAVMGSSIPAEIALRVEASNVAVYNGNISGGTGAPAGIPPFMTQVHPSQPGAAAVDLVSGSLLLSQANIFGGAGGSGYFDGAACWPSSNGSPAVELGGTLRLLGSTPNAGPAGFDPSPCPQIGVTPPPLAFVGGNVISVNETPRGLLTVSPAYPQAWAAVQFEGVPGELAVLLYSANAAGILATDLKGVLLPGPPLQALVFGTVGANGLLGFQTTVPAAGLPPGIESLDLHLQVLVAGNGGTGLLSGPSVLTILDV